jgi:hypothetical protein
MEITTPLVQYLSKTFNITQTLQQCYCRIPNKVYATQQLHVYFGLLYKIVYFLNFIKNIRHIIVHVHIILYINM